MKSVDRIGSAFLRTILRRMKELGVNNTELARRLKVSRPYLTKVFKGDVNFTFATAAHFARALEMDFFPTLTPKTDEIGSERRAVANRPNGANGRAPLIKTGLDPHFANCGSVKTDAKGQTRRAKWVGR